MGKEDKILRDLITGIDWSGSRLEPKNLYVLVSVKDRNYIKLKSYLEGHLNIRHWKKLSGSKEKAYFDRFLRE